MLDVLAVLQQNLIKQSISREFEWVSSMCDSENARKRLSQEESEETVKYFQEKRHSNYYQFHFQEK